jgi:hypothetical protein
MLLDGGEAGGTRILKKETVESIRTNRTPNTVISANGQRGCGYSE